VHVYVRQCAQVCTSGRECVQVGGREGKPSDNAVTAFKTEK